MMLLLGRLISLLLLLLRSLVKILSSLPMLLKFLIPRLMGRFVRRSRRVKIVVKRVSTQCTRKVLI
ncbi:hypothetical protein ANAPC1_00762 [Anaplasma phagocytophilum]|uniref:Uncharacterized protein n=1 Tax=Anaplasma phagocytophilum TaxID=948 RepID=A0AA45USZ4_ANAPH|nr:hypothetical protein [Anaplasma phagocytophilum]SBO14408.1 hypothetical protein ANAPC1_00762 [Anaplasma phagocytophilum]SBO30132.1 hypothetical protein ANAPC4_00107 [Anaplasma phagocytophilum]SBO33359.1 hypothetical protein ANAPC2_01334 [Anaplasma phagocytophilum]SBO33747.1 hypothetical protein ANAPC3_01337 [Anaplasma phagocytophilum]